jgi:predicted RNase H-like nuclease
MAPRLQDRIKEVHPELSFYELNAQRPMGHRKKSEGESERKGLLREAGFNVVLARKSDYPRAVVAGMIFSMRAYRAGPR